MSESDVSCYSEDDFFDALEELGVDFEAADVNDVCSSPGFSGSKASHPGCQTDSCKEFCASRLQAFERQASNCNTGTLRGAIQDAHLAAFVDDADKLQDILLEIPATDWTAYDPHGNTLLHVAVLRRSTRAVSVLLQVGFPLDAKNVRRWTALDEAVSIKDRTLVTQLLSAQLANDKKERKQKKQVLLRSLEQLPDYKMQIRWELGSTMFGLAAILRRYAPHDTYQIWKCGTRLRVDGTLQGFETEENRWLEWKRGHFSLIVDPATEPATLLLLDRRKETYVDFTAERQETKSSNLDEEVLALVNDGASKTKYKTSDVRFKPMKTWLGAYATEKVEGWQTRVFEWTACMSGVRRTKAPLRLSKDCTYQEYLDMKVEEDEAEEMALDTTSLFVGDQGKDKDKGRQGAGGSGSKVKKIPGPRKVSGKCWMAENFPMSLQQLLPLLDVIGTANRHISKVAHFLNKYGDLDLFPVKTQVPLVFTLYLMLIFCKFELLGKEETSEPDFFAIPESYSRKMWSARGRSSSTPRATSRSPPAGDG